MKSRKAKRRQGLIKHHLSSSKTEEELHEAQQKLNDIINFLPDATMVVDAKKRVIAWNKAMEKMTGVKRKDIIGKGNFEYSLPFYGKRRPILIDVAFMSIKEMKKKYDFIKKEGSTVYGEVYVPKTYRGKGAYLWGNASLLFDREGKVAGAIESIRDITDRKNAEQEASSWKERYELVTAASGQIAYECNLKDGTIIWGKSIESVLGYKLGEMKGGLKQWERLIHLEDRKMALRLLNEAENKQKPYLTEYRFKNKNGNYVWVRDHGLFSKTEKASLLMGMLTDITEQKKAQESLKESEEKYKGLFENGPDTIIIYDLKGKIIDANKAIKNHGFRRELMLGRNILSFVPKEWQTQGMQDFKQNVMGKQTSGETKIMTPVGERYTNYIDTPIRKNGKIVAIQSILRDITEKKQAEEVLKRTDEELTKKDEEVVEVNKQLEILNQNLVTLDRVKDNFLSSVSHELRTPLTSIKSYNQLLLDGTFGIINAEQKEAIEIVLASTNNLNKLISDLLDISKYEEGKAYFHFKKCDLKEVMEHILKEFDPVIRELQGDINTDLPKGKVELVADCEKIGAVFRNLISNAVKYRSKEKLKIEVSMKETSDDINISVKDNGIGIAEANQKNIFNKFYQVDQGMTKSTEGTGLGLSISKHIVEEHHGSISVKSELGKGSIFIVRLPRKPGLAESA